MCVIIYIPKGATISESEIKDAWSTNPDGAGYAVQLPQGVVKFHRGFMNCKTFYEHIKQYIGVNNIVLHFRISTSSQINQTQTHPYKKTDIKQLYGFTTKPVICMNGIISKQTTYRGLNDTMSYILDYTNAFAVINQDILNIITEQTNSKWFVMLPTKVYFSENFTEREGKYYSNTNHLYGYLKYLKSYCNDFTEDKKTFNNSIRGKKLQTNIKKDNKLYQDVVDFIEYNCNYEYNTCWLCSKCFSDCYTKSQVIAKLEQDYYQGGSIYD